MHNQNCRKKPQGDACYGIGNRGWNTRMGALRAFENSIAAEIFNISVMPLGIRTLAACKRSRHSDENSH